jgi:hypothetical protein
MKVDLMAVVKSKLVLEDLDTMSLSLSLSLSLWGAM